MKLSIKILRGKGIIHHRKTIYIHFDLKGMLHMEIPISFIFCITILNKFTVRLLSIFSFAWFLAFFEALYS